MMRNLLRCRRGTLALVTTIAAIPLIGFMAIGAEAGQWYLTRQHAQNAADAAAYSGALRLACSLTNGTCADTLGSPTCTTTSDCVTYRGKQFAARNAFCDGSYSGVQCPSLPAGTTQTVNIDIGNYSAGAWTSSSTGSYVKAWVGQQQPASLAAVFGVSTMTIGAQAIAKVTNMPTSACILALTGQISFQGSPKINAPGCGMASNSTATNAINMTGGNGIQLNLGSLSTAGECSGGNTSYCDHAFTNMPPYSNPFSALNGLTMPTLNACASGSLVAYGTGQCVNGSLSLHGNGNTPNNVVLNGGVYFVSGAITVNANASISGTGLIILLPGASLSTQGGGTISLTGNPSVSTSALPTVLQPYASLLANMVLYDRNSSPVTLGGNSGITMDGGMYLPQADVTFQGNPSLNTNTCGNQLVAKSIAFNGNSNGSYDFANGGCATGTKPISQLVALVQ